MLDLKAALLHVWRVKNGVAALHPLRGVELRALCQLQHASAGMAYVFVSERGSPLTMRTVYDIIAEAGHAAGCSFPVHPQKLRHACGFYLTNKGVDTRALQQYLGHRNIQHTVRYAELTPAAVSEFLGGLKKIGLNRSYPVTRPF
jgi:site-specific recombinase XerD